MEENKKYVVVISCLSYDDAKLTRDLINLKMGYHGYIDEVK